MQTKLFFLLLIIASISPSVYSENADIGDFYLGGNIGGDFIDGSNFQYTNDDSPVNLSSGIVGGYNINRYLSLETDLSYFGEVSNEVSGAELWGWSGYLLTRYSISEKAGLYFKLGASIGQHDWAPSAGAGVHYRLSSNWLLDVGYRWIDDVPNNNSDLYEFSIGGRYLFGVEQPEALPPIIDPKPEPIPEPEEILVTMDAGSLFAFDSDIIQQNNTMDTVVKDLRENDVMVTITGFTDSSGPEAYNQKLSERRANAVRDYLIAGGVPLQHIKAIGLGESMPVASNDTEDGRAQNRRVEIRYQIITKGE